jgi:hypothetical protein
VSKYCVRIVVHAAVGILLFLVLGLQESLWEQIIISSATYGYGQSKGSYLENRPRILVNIILDRLLKVARVRSNSRDEVLIMVHKVIVRRGQWPRIRRPDPVKKRSVVALWRLTKSLDLGASQQSFI